MSFENLRSGFFFIVAAMLVTQFLNLGQVVVGQDSGDSSASPQEVESSSSESFVEDTPSESQESIDDANTNQTDSQVESHNDDSESTGNYTATGANSTSSASSGTNSTEPSSDDTTAQTSDSGSDADQQGQLTETNSTSNDSLTNQNITSGVTNQTQTSNDVSSDNSTYQGNMTGIISNQTATYNNSTQVPSDDMVESTNNNSTLSNSTDSIGNTTALAVGPPPDFKISVDPSSKTIKAGATTTFAVSVSSKNNFTSEVSLTIGSRPISGIATYFSSNITKPRPDTDATSILTIKSDSAIAPGTYKIKITGSADITNTKSRTLTLNVTGAFPDKIQKSEPVALTSIALKDLHDNIINGNISSNRMVLISSTLKDNYNKAQSFVVIMEIRDKANHSVQYIQLQEGVLIPDGEAEIAISWIPDKVGIYEVRAFAVDKLVDPEFVSVTVGKTIIVESQNETSTEEDYTSIERLLRKS